ncbi:uncharacterized protein LOC129890331, partial [Solanum dulcamara]|uniref:uncharacterized protein LOC129890331 n=1 Tax=Solanum dulcamara TaxID=45834 RepID=UPI0024856457
YIYRESAHSQNLIIINENKKERENRLTEMACYIEEEAWKCSKHPSKKRRTTTGVCSICLRDRLSQLCPHCANVRPCSSNCAAASTTSLSSSSGKIDGGEPAFCRSKSVGIPFLKSRNVNSSSRRNQPESEKSNKIVDGSETVLCRSKSVGIPFLKSQNVNSSSRRNQPESEKSNKIVDGSETVLCRSKSVGIPFLKSQNVNSSSRRNQPKSEKSSKIVDGGETAFGRSNSVGIPFLKSRNVDSGDRGKTTESETSNKMGVGSETELCRSKSVGIPFLKSRNVNSSSRRKTTECEKSEKTAPFWWIFKLRKRGKAFYCNDTRIKEFAMTTVMRSRSVNAAMMTSVSGRNDVNYSPENLKERYSVSPMKVFRQSSGAPKLVN